MKKIITLPLLLITLTFLNLNCNSNLKEDISLEYLQTLKSNFKNPPNEAKPRVWWHWMNGNITKEGIQKDLEWMHETGIGGFQNFDANLFTPQVVEEKLVFMTDQWKEAFQFTTEKAQELGLEMAIAGSPGWSVTGGPWVPKEDGMKKYVWTETTITGGGNFTGRLEQPAAVVGKFQNVIIEEGGISGGFVGEKPNYYEDAFVIAYPLSEGEKSLPDFQPKVTSSGGNFSLKGLTDGDLHHSYPLPAQAVGEDMWIQYEFSTPQTFKALSVAGASIAPLAEFNGNPENRALKVSDDGINFKEIARLTGSTVPQNTVAFNPTTAKYWRMTWKTLPPPFNPFMLMLGRPQTTEPEGVNVAEFVLHNTSRIDQFEDKAGFSPWKEDNPTYIATASDILPKEQIIDLTDKMQEDGTLNWEAPAGTWKVIRFGYSLTGRQNHPASPEATGLEVDKLDEDAVRKYINAYLDKYQDATGDQLGEKGLGYMILDSYEAGHMNWTHDFSAEFEKRNGYSIVQWIPALTGRVVDNLSASEQFLWDFQKNHR